MYVCSFLARTFTHLYIPFCCWIGVVCVSIMTMQVRVLLIEVHTTHAVCFTSLILAVDAYE